jgi:hypothetical protein
VSSENVGIAIDDSRVRPSEERIARRPDLSEPGIDRSGEAIRVKDFGETARKGADEQSTNNQRRYLRIGSRRSV